MTHTLEQAKENYQNHSAFWAAELILAIEENAPGAALAWGIDSAERLLEILAPEHAEQYQAWIDDLRTADIQPQEELQAKIELIWYQYDDPLAKAIANLFAAKWEERFGKERSWYRTQLVGVMSNLGDAAEYRDRLAEPIFELFERYQQRTEE